MSSNPKKSEIIFQLYSRLKQSPCTVTILEDWKRKNGYTFSERTLYRYLDELSNNLKIKGEEIEIINGEYNKRTWKLVTATAGKELSTYDINTFYLLKTFVPKTILQLRSGFFEKLDTQFYNQFSKSKFERSVDAYTLGMKSTGFYEAQYTANNQEVIEQCIWSIQYNKEIIIESIVPHFDLDINRVKKNDTLLPLMLLNHRGLLHLVAYNRNRKCIIIIGFQAIEKLTLTNKNFKPEKYYEKVNEFNKTHFGITQNINDKTYNIQLEFDRGTGHYISCFFWHITQNITELPNGKILLSINCGINGELVGWISQWMNNVTIIKPKLLQALVKKNLVELVNQKKEEKKKHTFWK